jgi:hypothetical protein
VLKTMLLSKLKAVTAVLLSVLLGSSGLLALALVSGRPGELHGVPAPVATFIPLDLQARANQSRADWFHCDRHHRFPGNDLPLANGLRKFGGVPFRIGAKVIQLYGGEVRNRAAGVRGIAVGKKFAKLHLLHATAWTVDEGTVIGWYTVHYADRTRATIEIVYGRNVRDWASPSDPDTKVSRGKLAWEGKNDYQKNNHPGGKIRLFHGTWDNPHPNKQVLSIDFTSARTRSGPFCVAMTLQAR